MRTQGVSFGAFLFKNTKIILYSLVLILCAPFSYSGATELDSIEITENTSPVIAQIYQQLQDARGKITQLQNEKQSALEQNATAMHDKEQSLENRTLTAGTTMATGLGMMTAASAKAEQKADEEAEQDMKAYLATFKCEYGRGQSVKASEEEVTLPGGNELVNYYQEYKALADNLKNTKKALGLRSGIESEVVYDKAESNLYKYSSVGKTDGAFTSLSRALTDSEGEDAAAWNAQKEITSTKLKTGTIAAGAGVVGGIAGDYLINKDAPKEQSEEINRQYDSQIEEANNETQQIENRLQSAIAENEALVQDYNAQLQQHQDFVAEINASAPGCSIMFTDYVATISPLEPVSNKMDAVPNVDFPILSEQQDLLDNCNICSEKGGVFDPDTLECPCPADKPIEQDGKCVEQAPEVVPPAGDDNNANPYEPPVDETLDETPTPPQESDEPDPDQCPATGNALRSINDTHKVGDSCASDIISQGVVKKRQNGTCTCSASGCWTPYTPKNGKCVREGGDGSGAGGGGGGDQYVDADGFCKPFKSTHWFFNGENNQKVSEYFNKVCNDFATAHNCKRKDLNTGHLLEQEGTLGQPGYAFEYEYICNATADDWQAAQERINQRNANLTYENVCNRLGVDQTENKNGISRACIGLFDDLDISDFATQVEVIKAYSTERLNQSVVACSSSRDVRRNKATNNPNGYYVKCNSTDDKMRLTFIFSGIGTSDRRTPASYASLTDAACRIHNVRYVGHDNSKFCSYRLNLQNGKDAKCEKINTFAQRVGYFAQAESGRGCVMHQANNAYTRGGGRVAAQTGERRTAFGIDNDMFKNIATNMDNWLYDQLRIIVAEEMKNAGHSDPLVKFECFQRDYDNVLTCNANERPIDFAFKKLGRVSKRYANAAQEGLTCIFGSHGKYDGRKCWGLTQENCTKLDADIKAKAGSSCSSCGTQWHPQPEPGVCALTKSTKVEKTDVGLQIAGNALLLAGATVITVFTDGLGTPFVIMTATETAGLITEAVTRSDIRNKADQFLAKTQFCKDSVCAQELLDEDAVRSILNLESDLTDTQANTIDEELARLLTLIPPEAPLYVSLLANLADHPNCNFWHKLVAQCEWIQFINAWSQVAQFASLFAGLSRAAVKLVKSRKAIVEVTTKTARKMTRAQAKSLQDIDVNIARNNRQLKNTHLTKAQREALQADNITQSQLRNKILNQVGTHDADEIARLQQAAFSEQAIKDAQASYQKLLQDRQNWLNNARRHGRTPSKYELMEWDKKVTDAEQGLRNMGQQVTPAEPLWRGSTSSGGGSGGSGARQGAGSGGGSGGNGARQGAGAGEAGGSGARQGAGAGEAGGNGARQGAGSGGSGEAGGAHNSAGSGNGAGNGSNPSGGAGGARNGASDVVDDAGRVVSNATQTPGKTGFDLAQSLSESGIRPYRYEPGGFYGVKYRTGTQCATGLKFHVSVVPDDLERASFLIDDLVKNSDTVDTWKVFLDGIDGNQLGKDFTIYVSPNGYNSTKIQNFVNSLEDALRKNNIRSNGFGKNILSGDKKLPGSNYINYRYDKIDDMGHIHLEDPDFYNSSYNFTVPDAASGGDIMHNIGVM